MSPCFGPSRAWPLLAALLLACSARAVDCTGTTTGLHPLPEFPAGGLYLGLYPGGLYPDGLNTLPPSHLMRGIDSATGVVPRLASGAPNPSGKIVVMSMGMSNTTQEWCGASSTAQPCGAASFMAQASTVDSVNHSTMALVDGARGGQSAATWDSPQDPNYDRVRDEVLAPQGLSEAQVQVIWLKVANPGPSLSLPNAGADAFVLKQQIGAIARAIKVRYANVRLVFISSRIYAGYADTALNPEPYAYESGFAVKWAIEAQITQLESGTVDPQAGDLSPGMAPHLSWGPYLWGDGMTPREDGLVWLCSDFTSDGTHPATGGRMKVGQLLLNFFSASPLSVEWFNAAPPPPGDLNNDGAVDGMDLSWLVSAWGSGDATADVDDDGEVGGPDLAILLSDWTG